MTSVVERLPRLPAAVSRNATAARLLAILPLLAILAAAIALRFYGLNWDNGGMFHPDERFILMTVEGKIGLPWPLDFNLLLDPKTSPLNPAFFAYGSLPLYMLKLVAHIASQFQASFANADLRLVARAISAAFDTGTVLLTFFVGVKIGGKLAGTIASALVAFSVLHIQLAHFYAVDTILVFFLMLTLWIGLEIIEKPALWRSVLMGAVFGLALATKVSVAPLAIAVAMAHLLSVLGKTPEERGKAIEAAIGGTVFAGITAVAVFLVTQPFTLLDRETFLANFTEQSEMVRRIRDYPYTRQYVNTAKYWYQIVQVSLFGLGLPFGITGWLGFLYVIARGAFLRRRGEILLLSWAVPYFAITGGFEVKFLRYLLPLTPLLAIFAARLLVDLIAIAEGFGNKVRWGFQGLAAVVVASTMLFGFAYVQIYSRVHPAVQMSRWINQNVPPGTIIAKEHWEEGLPNLGQYKQTELPMYDDDTPNKLQQIANTLSAANYILFFSNRLYGTVPRLPERYPMSREYYELLFSGKLGYELVHADANYPALFGVALMDDTFVRPNLPRPAGLDSFLPSPRIDMGFADESFSVYDHPLVMIFKKTGNVTPQFIAAQLSPFLPKPGSAPPTSSAAAKNPNALMLSPELAAADQAGGTWTAIFNPDALPNKVPLLFWWLGIEVMALAALPLAMAAGRRLPDGGFILAKPLGVLLVAWLAFLGASIRMVPYERWSIILAIVLVALASGLVIGVRRRALLQELRERRGAIIAGQLVFIAAFLAFAWVRSLNPDLWHPARGGEKPMDFAYLNAVIRTTYFPAYDPWFSGGFLNYYYFGQVIVATITKFTGIVPEVAYNLAVASLAALTAALAWSIVYNLARFGRLPSVFGERRAWLAGIVGAVLVVVAGNLDGLAQVLDGLRTNGQPLLQTQLPILGGAVQAADGLLRLLQGQGTMPPFDFWRSSRMMPPQISITEFPFFTFLFADLHAHLIALPLTLLAIVLALNLAFGARGIWPVVALAITVGALRPANTWDYPTYFALALAAIAIGLLRSSLAGFLWGVAWRAVVLYLVGYLAFLPYYQHYELFYSGVTLSQETTPLHQYLAVNGLFLFLGISWVIIELARKLRGSPGGRLARLAVRHWDHLPHLVALTGRLGKSPLGLLMLTAFALVALLGVVALVGLPTPAFIGLLLIPTVLLGLRRLTAQDSDTPRDLFVICLFGLGLALGAAVDIVTVQGDIARMNTVFKFYEQAWVLMALASAYAFWRLVLDTPEPETRASRRVLHGLPRAVWSGALTFLIVGVLIYPVAATPVRVRDRFGPTPPTLDGQAYMQDAVYRDEHGPMELKWDRDAIDWLRLNLHGTPVIVEGVTPFYRWGSRISVNTGLPTVIGWDWHQKQQRWDYQTQVDQRINEVNTFFSTTDPNAAMGFLKKYGVRYVIVGDVERLYYPPAGIAKFDHMTNQLTIAYRNPGMTIYEVTT